MSLFKQLSIMLTLFLAVILTSVMILNFKTANEFIQNQLYSDAKNTAHSLGLSLSKVADPSDTSSMDTMINAIFDSGYYEAIVLKDLDGKVLYERKTEVKVNQVPQWFIKAVEIHQANATTDIMMGWSRFGSLEVSAHTGNAYRQLYTTLIHLLETFMGIGFVVFGMLYLLLSISLKSLKRLGEQAKAISENQFIIEDKIPFTTEFRSVTVAMNATVKKVKDIFDRENETLSRYHELLYRDSETKLYNRRYLIATLPDYLVLSSGTYMMFSFDELDRVKREMGYEKYSEIIHFFTQQLSQMVEIMPNTLVARLNDNDFFTVVPTDQREEIHAIARDLMEKLKNMILGLNDGMIDYINLSCAIGEYGEYDTVKSLFSRADYVVTRAKLEANFTTQLCNNCNDQLIPGREEWRSELIKSLEESRILLASQKVIERDATGDKTMHDEIFLRLKDRKGTIHSAAYFIPVATSLGIVESLDRYMIEKVIEDIAQGIIKTSVALNLSADFVKKYDNVEWLKNKLDQFHEEHSVALWFEVSNTIALQELEAVHSMCVVVKSFGDQFGIDHFVMPQKGAEYLQIIRPDYVKSNSAYLEDILGDYDSGDARESLINIVTSLGITMIAIAIESEEQIIRFNKHGITKFQGMYVAPAALIC
jgi:EAL domain-containing protein (putative c-di-GMP-specific phosphodiesterase class I)/GGDEF domain-containing protein